MGNTWKKHYAETYYAYQLRNRGQKAIDETGYVLIRNYPDVTTHKGFEEAVEKYITWIGGFAQNTPTVGTPKHEGVLVGGKLVRQLTGYHYAKGGKGKQDLDIILNGVNVKLELKCGSDEQKPQQRKYQERVEKAGGVYVIIRTMSELFHICQLCLSGQSLHGLKFYEK